MWCSVGGVVHGAGVAHSLIVVVLREGKKALIISFNTSYWNYLQTFYHEMFQDLRKSCFYLRFDKAQGDIFRY